MSEDKYALSEAWSNSNEYKKPFDYTLENTRQTVLLRRLDMGDLLKLGIAEELDFMSKALFADDSSASAKEAVNTAVLKSQNFTKMEHMVNSVVMAGVIKPQLHAIPLHEAARQPGLVVGIGESGGVDARYLSGAPGTARGRRVARCTAVGRPGIFRRQVAEVLAR